MRVFISYFGNGDAFVPNITKECRAKHIEVISQNLKFASSSRENLKEIKKKLEDYDCAIVVWSADYEKDFWLRQELSALIAVEMDRLGRFIYPLIIDSTPLHPSLKDPVNGIDHLEQAIMEVVASLPEQNDLFVAMAFGNPDLDSAYETIIKPIAIEKGFNVVRIDEREDSGSISSQILWHIERSGVILCELTGERPNVYFEAGYAIAKGKETILCARKDTNVHFDLKDRRLIIWETPRDLKAKLDSRLNTIVNRRNARASDLPQ